MRTDYNAGGLTAYVVAGAVSLGSLIGLAGCGRDSNVSSTKGLEDRVVLASELVGDRNVVCEKPMPQKQQGEEELDLSTPEKFVEAYVLMTNKLYAEEITAEEYLDALYCLYNKSNVKELRRTVSNIRKIMSLRMDTAYIAEIEQNDDGTIRIGIGGTATKTLNKTREVEILNSNGKGMNVVLRIIGGQYKAVGDREIPKENLTEDAKISGQIHRQHGR